MNHILRYAMGCLAGAFSFTFCVAQADSLARRTDSAGTRRQLAIFAPLYLDSAFDATGNYRYDKNFPKFINPGLEFYEGAKLAMDSLAAEHAMLEVHVYDTRSATQSLGQILQSTDFQQTGLILGHVNAGEMLQLAAAASRLNIPFVNVNYPNDGGITNNPDVVLLNSTLRTHCEGIYRYVQRNYATKPIIAFRKKGPQEDRLKNYFIEIERTTASVPLKIRYVTLDDNFDAAVLAPYLDSNTQTICLAASLDENFGKSLCLALASLSKTYHSTVIGMPTWDNISDFSLPEYANEEIIYTTPFYVNPTDNLTIRIQQYFRTKFYSRPSDMVFRGYETTWRFAKLLIQYGKDVAGSVGVKKYKVFNDFDIQPVFLNKQTMTLDYLENKKLYFIKKLDGNVTTVN
ncbi:MAG: amino acid ABC transporter substrate-binding protein [Bacteroidota bacterium]|nr:amino acid ABC transporter substrate-binding protein [Bacteroidota bacterium]MDP4217248.1 amino acid ABC transporter substrate-binding protein [Bacteroidota bacterium]MDP4244921.1 amino acid ABC transporter substrate-binding protein [Bacteroidota bacterium]MDP4255945.1 amino acid ABC transporter substrate-binding protein [Bacteroidota bacterium]MDP4257579.1 amino acid ABC transporter substrate-binding protein [Bacteroidota bacterium]